MSRYSPTVLPEASPDFGRGIIDAARLAYELKRQGAEDDLKRRDADIGYYGKGGRTGTAPSEQPTTVTVPDVPTFTPPGSDALAEALRGGPFTPRGTAPFVAPDSAALGRELSGGNMIEDHGITGVPSTSSGHVFGDGSDMQGPSAVGGTEDTPRRDRAQLHAGAFDPATRSFGGSPLQMAIAQAHATVAPPAVASPGRTVTLADSNPRYVQLDPGHYVDNLHTPDAERDRDREAQARLASELRGHDIETRGQQALTLEQQRQQGRVDLRERINQSHLAEILTRGDVAGGNSAAHDARVDKRAAAHDARTGAGSGGKPQTAGQRELNARMAADGVIAASDGSYDRAVDWLEHTPEGQDAQRNGLSPRHLYAAMGKFHNLLGAQSVRLQSGAAMDTPEEANTAIDQTRKGIAARGKAPAAGGPVNESTLSDADLWGAKVAAGMTKQQATDYVKKRKRTP